MPHHQTTAPGAGSPSTGVAVPRVLRATTVLAVMLYALLLSTATHAAGGTEPAYLGSDAPDDAFDPKCPKPECTPAYFTPPDPSLGPKPPIRNGESVSNGYLSAADPQQQRRWRDDLQMITSLHFGSRRLELSDQFGDVQSSTVQVTSISFGLRYQRRWWTAGASYGIGFGANSTGLMGNGGNWVGWFARLHGGLRLVPAGENKLGLSGFATAHIGVSDFSICAYGVTNVDLCADATRFAWGPDIGIAIKPWERIGFVLGYLGDYSSTWVEHSGYLGFTMQSSPRAIIAFAAVPLYVLLFGALN